MKENRRCTGGPRSGGIIILLFPPALMSLIPSSNPTSENVEKDKSKPMMKAVCHTICNCKGTDNTKYILPFLPGTNALLPMRIFAGEPCK